MKSKGTAPTMKDVAQEAGVALGTVSKVFNGIPVGESYRVRVEEAAKKLGYQVNSYARGLRASKTNTVALIMPSIRHPFFADLTDALTCALMRRDYRVILQITNYDPEGEQKCLNMVRQNKVDGVIALTYNPDLVVEEGIPFVSFDRYFGPNIPCIASDNYGGGQLAAEKLIELGCKKLLFFRSGSEVSGEADKRGLGFEMACQARNADYYSLRKGDEDGLAPFFDFLDEHFADGKRDYDGIFCCTDSMAYQTHMKLQELGVKVPEEVQIIGYDGLRKVESDEMYCSSIIQPIDDLAETAVDIVLKEDRSRLPSLMCLPVSYKAGGTTKDSDPIVRRRDAWQVNI